ncbi:hypothetical protein niasHS_002366 [Heterodera schachtii]|uniref:Uncharacterized protein n=1 Tax=Heterodera schachtii TaxID=97005 RepID=A0ABD2KKM6_HETSC
MAPPRPSDGGAGTDGMPDLSHLSQEERQIILQVLQRQKAEEQQEEEIAQKGDRELWDIERQIQGRKEIAQRLIGTQDDAICQICQKTKFADGIGHKCFYCQLRSCARCGGRTTSKSKTIWACSLCQKRQQILAKTGKWFQQKEKQLTTSTPSPGGGSSAPISRQHSEKSPVTAFGDFGEANPPRRQSVAAMEERTAQGGGGGGHMRRQNTLHRQNSVEEHHQCQLQQQQKVPSASEEQRKNGEREAATGPKALGSPGGSTPAEAQNSHRQNHRQMPLENQSEEMNKPNGQLPNSDQRIKSQERKQQQRQRTVETEAAERGEKRRTNGENGGNGRLQSQRSEERRKQQQQRLPTTPAAVDASSSAASKDSSGRQYKAEEGHTPQGSLAGAVSSTVSRHSAVASSGGVPSPMRRRQKASRQQKPANCSSSDDELSSPKAKPTTQQFQQTQPPPLPKVPALSNSTENGARETEFSEKELLRYIYDNSHPNARKVQRGAAPFLRHFFHRSFDSPAMLSAASGVAVSVPFGNAIKVPTADAKALASRIRNYLSNPAVSWQPSTDQRRLIGHMVLTRPSRFSVGPCSSSSSPGPSNSSLDFGVKVVGGRSPLTGRFGAFVSRVRPGSVAESVGQLKTGDEVLEWNGHSLQNVTPEAVYKIVQATKGDVRLELIVSRSLISGGDDFLNLGQIHEQYGLGPSPSLPHSQSLNTSSPFGHPQRFSQRAPSPLVLHQGRSFSDFFDPMSAVWPPPLLAASSADPHEMCRGRIELALLYLRQKRELIISLSGAFDLFPRANGTPRNAYVKLFLLPDRSEKSRRQSKVIADTLAPVWNEHFFYEGLDERAIAERVLEVTLWDFDAFGSHSFLGETLIELSNAPLNNRTLVYPITDLDDDNLIRLRLRQRRFSSMTPPMGQRSRSQLARRGDGAPNSRDAFDPWEKDAKRIGGGNSHSAHNLAENHSRNKRFAIANEDFWKTSQEDWTRNEEDDLFSAGWERGAKRTTGMARRIPNGYLSDQEQEWETERRRHGMAHRREKREHRHHRAEHRDRGGQRRPQSATALRNIAEWEMRHKASSDRGKQYQHQQSMDFSEGGRNGEAMQRQQIRRATRQQELREREAGGGGGGYGSDGSEETLMSVNSAQSMQNKAILRQQQLQRLSQQNDVGQSSTEENNERMGTDALPSGGDAEEMDDPQMMMMAMEGRQGGGTAQQKMTLKELKERKKSLMTRLIPGRNGLNEANKRLGFARSEEVGIPEALAPPEQNKDFIKQESTDSSDNWLPIRPDRPLGSFVENLGPGQVVGRQALGSAQLGELQAALSLEPCGMAVDIMQARGLTALKQSTKTVPGIYVKAYLMEGKNCLAKAKTQPTKTKSSSPQFRQKLVFAEGPRFRMLQLTVLADYGRIERKSFLGVAQIALDELQLNKEPLLGWFKLFPSSSLNGGAQPPLGGEPSRKNSEGSAN